MQAERRVQVVDGTGCLGRISFQCPVGRALQSRIGEAGTRIQDLFVGDRPVRRDARYAAAYVTSQAVPAHYGTARHDLPLRAVDALRAYFVAHRPASAGLRGTFTAV